jgi:lipopolysaccharide export system permease protein
MIGLGALAASSELVVIQSSGVSRLKIAWITIATLLVWLVPMTLIGEYVIPPAKSKAESFKKLKLTKDVGLGAKTGVWIRDGNIIFNAKPISSAFNKENQNIVMHDVTVYELDDKLQVIKVSKAEKAIHNKINWELHNLEVTEFEDKGVSTKLIEKQIWPSRIKPEILSIAHSRPRDLSIKDIIKYRKFQASDDSIPIKYEIALWFKLSYPLLVIATALTGLPFLFGLVRSGGFGQRLLIGVMLGIVLYLAKWILQNVGEVFHVHPSLITALPSSIILATVLLYLRVQKKG